MKKYTYGEVKSYFEKRNLTLLSTEYVNNIDKILSETLLTNKNMRVTTS